MTVYFNDFFLRGGANKADLGLLLIKKQDSVMSEQRDI